MQLRFPLALLVAVLAFAAPATASPRATPAAPAAKEAEPFGLRLVAAARRQTWIPTLYSPAYTKLDYPMGDVSMFLGVCTDVVVRAYRTLGLDLQELVHEARAGSGDANIDHRRVEVQRKFFSRFGVSLPVTANAADYQPGDIVTYHVPDGTFSKTHVAIVSDRKTSSGVPLVIHNRGFSVQEEDWLFAARTKLTGHYRYTGPAAARSASRGN